MKNLRRKLLARLLTRFPSLADRFIERVEGHEVSGVVWTPFRGRLRDAKVAIVTTAGVHLKGQERFDMEDKDGDPTFRVLPSSAPVESYAITHDYYDHSDADRDINIVFPIERLRELAEESFIGGVAANNYGFMGHIDGRHMDTLVNISAPRVAGMLRQESIDCVLLTPG